MTSALPWFIWLAAAAVASALPMLAWSLHDPAARQMKAARKNQQRLASSDARTMVLSQGRMDRLVAPALESAAARIGALAPSSLVAKVDRKLRLAGKDAQWTAARLLTLQIVGVVIGGGLGIAMWLGNPTGTNLLFAVSMAASGFKLPEMAVTRNGASRQEEIQRDLPDILDQVTITVEAGLGFDAALSRVAGDFTDHVNRHTQWCQHRLQGCGTIA